ncbi:MAG: hypothetical protein R6U22_03975 [Desulfohalobiaceae bacterium]
MLQNISLHLPSIGTATERKFWNSGIRSMHDFLQTSPKFISFNRQKSLSEHINMALESLNRQYASYFCAHLPAREHWRIFREHKDKAAYIDIETTGLGNAADVITAIAQYDGKSIKYYIQGHNLQDFNQDIREYNT